MARNITLTQLQTDIANQCDVATGASGRYSTTLLTRMINQSIQRFRERVSAEGITHYLVSTSGTLSIGATAPYAFQVLDLSSINPSIVRIFGVDLRIGARICSLTYRPFTKRNDFGGPTDTGIPIAWSLFQTRQVALLPAPDDRYTYTVWYLPVLPDLVAGVDTFDGVAGWEQWIVWDVACGLIARDQYQTAYSQAVQMRNDVWQDVIRGTNRVSAMGGGRIGRDIMQDRFGRVTLLSSQGSGSGDGSGFTASPLSNILYVDQEADPGGTGAPSSPVSLLSTAIGMAADLPQATTIYLCPGDYDADHVTYADKRLSVQGTQLFNQSAASTPTHGVFLRPTSSDNSAMVLEVSHTNCNIVPQSFGIIVILEDAYCEAISDNVHVASFHCTGSPDTMRIGTEGTTQDAIYMTGGGIAESVFNQACEQTGGETLGTISVIFGYAIFKNTLIRYSISVGTTLAIYNCHFPVGGSGILFAAGTEVITDLATYARGLEGGVTWPENTRIIDEFVPLQPVWINSGGGVNSLTDLALPYGTNAAGDRFVAHVNCIDGGGSQVPATPAGWTLQGSATSGNTRTYVYTRDTASTGGEAGTVTWVIALGNTTNGGVIHTFRHVEEVSVFVESVVNSSASGAGPTARTGPTVTATGAGRLACVFGGSNSDASIPTTITGQTGGTWVDRFNASSGLGATYDLQTTALATSGTVTGGTGQMAGTRIAQVALALIGEVA